MTADWRKEARELAAKPWSASLEMTPYLVRALDALDAAEGLLRAALPHLNVYEPASAKAAYLIRKHLGENVPTPPRIVPRDAAAPPVAPGRLSEEERMAMDWAVRVLSVHGLHGTNEVRDQHAIATLRKLLEEGR